MKRITTKILRAAMVAVFLMPAVRQAAAGDITYNFVNDAVDQNGWSLAGTITTDGTTNAFLNPSDILAFSVTLTEGSTTVILTPGSVGFEGTSGLYATASSLQVDAGDAFSLTGSGSFLTAPYLEWNNNQASGGPAYDASQNDSTYWYASPPSSSGPFAGTTWTIASVPEPSTLAMGAIATLAGLGMWIRRRASRRGQSPASDNPQIVRYVQ
jgi:hypothetical protein